MVSRKTNEEQKEREEEEARLGNKVWTQQAQKRIQTPSKLQLKR